MPCDQVQTTRVELNVANPELLADALESLGFRVERQGEYVRGSHRESDVQFSFAGGQAKLTSSYASKSELDQTMTSVRRAYGVQCVKAAAGSHGWSVNFDNQTQRIVAVKRRY